MKKKFFFVVPLVLFFIMVGFLVVGLQLDPRKVPSPLIGKKIPEFELLELDNNRSVISNKDLPSTPYLLNVWASWCRACGSTWVWSIVDRASEGLSTRFVL